MAINFFNEDISYTLKEKNKYKKWLKKIISIHNYSPGEITYILCSDSFLYDMNVQYLNHHTYTDIITFDNSEQGRTIEGDIFISIDRVMDNSLSNGIVFEDELKRVMVHGILHLLGFKDKEEKDKKLMREKEDESLSFFKEV